MKVVRTWSKIGKLPTELVAKNFGDDPKQDWVMQRMIMTDTEVRYQFFINVKGCRFNWLLKLWLKLNPSPLSQEKEELEWVGQ